MDISPVGRLMGSKGVGDLYIWACLAVLVLLGVDPWVLFPRLEGVGDGGLVGWWMGGIERVGGGWEGGGRGLELAWVGVLSGVLGLFLLGVLFLLYFS